MSVIANVCGAHAATEICLLDAACCLMPSAYWLLARSVCDCVCDLVIASFTLQAVFELELESLWQLELLLILAWLGVAWLGLAWSGLALAFVLALLLVSARFRFISLSLASTARLGLTRIVCAQQVKLKCMTKCVQ